jgi:hypothetical protein
MKITSSDIPIELVEPHYNFLKKMHMSCEKMQLKQGFSYVKYAGLFLAISFLWITLTNRDFFSDYLSGIICMGFGVLFVSAMHMIFIISNIDWQLAQYTDEGKEVEEKYPTLIQSRHFRTVDAMKVLRYRLALALRFAPFIFVGILTIAAGVALAMRTSTNMAAIIGSISAAVLSIVVFFLARATKKRCLLRSEQGE